MPPLLPDFPPTSPGVLFDVLFLLPLIPLRAASYSSFQIHFKDQVCLKLSSHPHHPSPLSLLSSCICLCTLCSSSQHTGFLQLILYPVSTVRSRQRLELVHSVSSVPSPMPGRERMEGNVPKAEDCSYGCFPQDQRLQDSSHKVHLNMSSVVLHRLS